MNKQQLASLERLACKAVGLDYAKIVPGTVSIDSSTLSAQLLEPKYARITLRVK